MADSSRAPFGTTLRSLLALQDTSLRELARRTKHIDPRGLSNAYLSQLATGRNRPTVANMLLIARALGVDPVVFREYRQHLAGERAAALAGELELDDILAALAALGDRNGVSWNPAKRIMHPG